MKTVIEIQHKELNVKDVNIDKFVKEALKNEGVKATEVDTLNVYYIPETAKLHYVAVKKDGSEVKGELAANDVPEYPEAPAKKPAAKKAAPKAKPAAKAETKVEAKPVAKATPAPKAAAKPAAKKPAVKAAPKPKAKKVTAAPKPTAKVKK